MTTEKQFPLHARKTFSRKGTHSQKASVSAARAWALLREETSQRKISAEDVITALAIRTISGLSDQPLKNWKKFQQARLLQLKRLLKKLAAQQALLDRALEFATQSSAEQFRDALLAYRLSHMVNRENDSWLMHVKDLRAEIDDLLTEAELEYRAFSEHEPLEEESAE